MPPSPYSPNPVCVEDIGLSEELEALLERLAANAHDVWAAQRLADGWSYGPKRDDTLRCHPCLVAYSELSEEEKTYDRLLVEQTLKTILKLGYEIRTPPSR
jgi:hypothetical protein